MRSRAIRSCLRVCSTVPPRPIRVLLFDDCATLGIALLLGFRHSRSYFPSYECDGTCACEWGGGATRDHTAMRDRAVAGPARAWDVHHRHGGEPRRLHVVGHSSSNRTPPTISSAGVAVAERGATAARAEQLVAVPGGEGRFVSQFDGERNRSQEQVAVAPYLGVPLRPVGLRTDRPDDAVVEAAADLDLVRTRFAPDLRATSRCPRRPSVGGEPGRARAVGRSSSRRWRRVTRRSMRRRMSTGSCMTCPRDDDARTASRAPHRPSDGR